MNAAEPVVRSAPPRSARSLCGALRSGSDRGRTAARSRFRRLSRSASGFTLAEVAVTIVIVGIGLLLVLQGLNTAKLTAAHTRNYKLARELALVTLGQVAAGLFQEDVENGLAGSYAEEGYPEFSYEVVVGDETFKTQEDGRFDSWTPRDEPEKEEDEKDPQEETSEPYEKVKIRITFPKIQAGQGELKNELVLEQWIPWKQVYGEKEAEEESAEASPAEAGTADASGGGQR